MSLSSPAREIYIIVEYQRNALPGEGELYGLLTPLDDGHHLVMWHSYHRLPIDLERRNICRVKTLVT